MTTKAIALKKPKKRKRLYRPAIFLLMAGAAAFLLLVFVPRSYPVPPLRERPGTAWWQLSTGSRIAYLKVPAQGLHQPFPVIYLHGGPGGHVHDALIRSLAPLALDGHDLYFYDQAGSGLSGRLNDITEYTVDRQVADLAAIIKTLGTGKVILVGQSWGAILATIYAARNPGQVDRLVLCCPGPVFPVQDERRSLPAPDSLHLRRPYYTNAQGNQAANHIRAKAMYLFANSFGWKLATDREADEFATFGGALVDRSTVCDTAAIPAAEAGNGYYAGVRTYKSLLEIRDYRAALRVLDLPVLVLKGQCDNQPWGYTSEYLELFRNHRLKVIPGAGHFLWVEQPDALREAIRPFLAEPVQNGTASK